jgi:hypothetical protein
MENPTEKMITELLKEIGAEDRPLNRAYVRRMLIKEWARGYVKGREYGELIGAGKL